MLAELTYKEILEQNTYLRTICKSQTDYIHKLEKDYINAINDSLNLAKEIDILTQEVFDSPKITRSEYVV